MFHESGFLKMPEREREREREKERKVSLQFSGAQWLPAHFPLILR